MSYYGKKGLCMCFNFQIAFRKECKGVTVFRARTSFLNTSYLFQSHYCNARFAFIRNPFDRLGTGALVVSRRSCGKKEWMTNPLVIPREEVERRTYSPYFRAGIRHSDGHISYLRWSIARRIILNND